MSKVLIAERWPNKLGWNVGNADVRDIVRALRVNVPIPSRKEWRQYPLTGYPRYVYIERYKVCDVPLGTDPVIAVKLCSDHGLICEIGQPICDEIPFVRNDQALLF